MPKKTTAKQASRGIKTAARVSTVIARKRAGLLRQLKRPTGSQIRNAMDWASPSGQSAFYGKLTRVALTLDVQTLGELRRVGGGSASDGARRLARQSKEAVSAQLFLPQMGTGRRAGK